MKKAIAEFRASYTTILAEVTVQPIRLAACPFGRRPNLFMFFMLFMVNYLMSMLNEPLNWQRLMVILLLLTGKYFKFLGPCNAEKLSPVPDVGVL